MSFYDEARQKVRQQKQSALTDSQVSENTKTGYSREVKQRSEKQERAKRNLHDD